MLHGLLLHTGMTSAGGTLLSGREACDDACSAQKPGPETRAQPSLWHGAASKPVQLISIGLENFETGDWSAKKKLMCRLGVRSLAVRRKRRMTSLVRMDVILVIMLVIATCC